MLLFCIMRRTGRDGGRASMLPSVAAEAAAQLCRRERSMRLVAGPPLPSGESCSHLVCMHAGAGADAAHGQA